MKLPMKRKFFFIINPRSGKQNAEEIICCIQKHFEGNALYSIGQWTNLTEFDALAATINHAGYTDIVAVGGDGSVNLTARRLVHSDLTLGIIPTGSGNGLARSLGISLNPNEALKQISIGTTIKIDSGEVNGTPFFCTSGMGFDAHIGKLFANLKTRGLKTYIKLIVKEIFNYQPAAYSITIDGIEIQRKAFLITIANAGQYGNDFYMAPQAKLNDGLFHVVILKPFSLLNGIGTVMKVLQKKANKASLIETFTGKEIVIMREKTDSIHYDGEPDTQGTELHYKIHPLSLKVIIGNKFDGL